MNNYSLFTISFSLFLLMDPIGNIPIYLAVLKDVKAKRQQKIIIRELLIALAVIILFSFVGEQLLDILGVGQETILISGGIILFMIAIKMIFPSGKEGTYESLGKGEPFIVPLAIPLVAGPSVLAAVMIYSHQEMVGLLIGAICIAWAGSMIILLGAPFLKKILGIRGIVACERLMGLLLTLMSVQMFLEGLSLYLQK
ncbi:MAG: YhgN family NAAT transporter [Simkaniaceae bacterium]|nr:MAG: YhgN family NAAT transporter [Simkaniaceae bacterium]